MIKRLCFECLKAHMIKVVMLAIVLSFSFGTASNSLTEESKTPINDHQQCITDWAHEQGESKKYKGLWEGAAGSNNSLIGQINSLKDEVASLKKLLDAAMAKIPDVKN